ncbi:MAG: hypothetical protein LBT01_08000 [Spirochaetaceae bacterium]|jgi:hypothetical protein|nr:hypothetical protein [Spirochaetaceae bacterium]
MAEMVDLYTLIRTYSSKNNSPVIDLEFFIKFLERNAEGPKAVMLHLDGWKNDTRGKVMRGLAELLQANKIEIQIHDNAEKIIIPHFYADAIAKAYMSINESGKTPFPGEASLRVKIPLPQLRSINVETDLVNYLGEEHNDPTQIIKLIFQEHYGSAVSLEVMYPGRMLEVAVLKIEDALRQRSEMEFFTQQLISHCKGQDAKVRDFINILMTRPMDSIKNIEEASDFVYSAWIFLCSAVCVHVEELVTRNNERTSAHVAMVQAAAIIQVYNNYYRIKTLDRKDKEHTFALVDSRLLDPPYMYQRDDINDFKTASGTLMMQRCESEDLEAFLHEKTTPADSDKLPPLLKFKGRDGVEWFVKKERVFPLCTKLLVDSRSQIKNDIHDRWMKLLRAYGREDAMDDDKSFENLIFRLANLYTTMLVPIVQDTKVALLQTELMLEKGFLPRNERFFDGNKPVELRKLLILRREDLLRNVKLALPFWFSIKPLVNFIRMLRGGNTKKPLSKNIHRGGGKGAAEPKNDHEEGWSESARRMARELIPENTPIESYLDTLNNRWNQLINKKDQYNAREDVQAIIRAYLHKMMKITRTAVLSRQMLDESAETIVRTTPALVKVNNKNALRLFIKIYMTKLLMQKEVIGR